MSTTTNTIETSVARGLIMASSADGCMTLREAAPAERLGLVERTGRNVGNSKCWRLTAEGKALRATLQYHAKGRYYTTEGQA